MVGIGAGALVASFFIGTGDITIATSMGARFGFDMWWTYFVLGLAGWALMDMSVRYFLRFGRTPLSLFKEIHPLLCAYLFLTVVVTTIVGAYSQWNACAHVLSGFIPWLPSEAGGALSALAALLFLAFGVYRRVEALCAVGLLLLVMLFALAAAAAGAPWKEALSGLWPKLPPPPREEWSRLIQANAGSLINAWLVLIYPYTMIEKGWFSPRPAEQVRILQRARWDFGVGVFAAAAVALPIMAAAREVAQPFGIVPGNYTEFAALLEPISGGAATSFFLLGLYLAAWTSGVGWIVCGAYAMLDIGNLELRLRTRPFRLTLVIFVAASSAILFLRVNPFDGIRIFAAFLAVVFPVVALAMVWRLARSDMDYFRWWPWNWRGALVVILDLYAVAVSLVVGWGMIRDFWSWVR
jgi:Mn2+/Fe2+ NRAMP family transporter